MNRYAWVVVATIAMFTFSPRRSQDPLGAVVIALASGLVMAFVLLAIDGTSWLIRKAKRVKYPPLLLAAADGNVHQLKELLRLGANINERGPSAETALMLAARNGRADAVKFLLGNGADRTMSTAKGSTAGSLATRFNHSGIAQLLSE